MYPGITSYCQCKAQYYLITQRMDALLKELEHIYKIYFLTIVNDLSVYLIPNPLKTS